MVRLISILIFFILTIFVSLIPASALEIKLETPKPSGFVRPTPSGQIYIIDKDPTKCKPLPCKTLKLTLSKEGEKTVIDDGETKAKTMLPVSVEEGKLMIGEKGSKKEVLLPSEARKKVEKGSVPVRVNQMELIHKNGDNIYRIVLDKENKFLKVFSVKSRVDCEVDAENGRVLKEEKPWYLKTVPFLFGE